MTGVRAGVGFTLEVTLSVVAAAVTVKGMVLQLLVKKMLLPLYAQVRLFVPAGSVLTEIPAVAVTYGPPLPAGISGLVPRTVAPL